MVEGRGRGLCVGCGGAGKGGGLARVAVDELGDGVGHALIPRRAEGHKRFVEVDLGTRHELQLVRQPHIERAGLRGRAAHVHTHRGGVVHRGLLPICGGANGPRAAAPWEQGHDARAITGEALVARRAAVGGSGGAV